MAMGMEPYVKIYVARADGTFLYDWRAHALKEVSKEDIRGRIGKQDFVAKAPCTLIFVSDSAALSRKFKDDDDEEEFAAVAAGAMTQNVYLASGALGIGTRYIRSARDDAIERILSLRDDDDVLCIMPMGVDYDIEHTVFSYIPNTAEMAYYGMMEGLQKHLDRLISEQLSGRGASLSEEEIRRIFAQRIRSEKVILKDIKLRTFIAEGNTRNDLAAHVYDITYGSITPHVDNLVIIDDSIVRGTTLKQSIVSILDRLHPKKIVVVSSSPQIRYPDYYGIDMSSMGEFIAFRMAIELLISRGMEHVIIDTYNKAKQQQGQPEDSIVNCVKDKRYGGGR